MSAFFVVAVWLILSKYDIVILILYVQPAMSAIGYLPRRAFWQNCCVNLSIQNTIHQRELHICARSEAQVCALLMSACTHLLTARVSSRPLALKFLNWQSLHEFSLNTDINVCCSGLTCARALSAPGWWWNKWQLIIQHTALALNKSEWFVHFFFSFHSCYCNVLGSQNAHPLKETYISRTLLFTCYL